MVFVLPIVANDSKPVTAPAKVYVPVPVEVVVSFMRSASTRAITPHYAIRIIAFDASAVGNAIVKVPAVEVLLLVKSKTQTALLLALLL